VIGDRNLQTSQTLLNAYPALIEQQSNRIIITRKQYEKQLSEILKNYSIVETPPSLGERILKIDNKNAPVAFIPTV
jgi:hypothetical protein